MKAIELLAKERYPESREVDIITSLGLSPANYYRMRSSDGNYPTLDQCAEISILYGISPAWLITGKGFIKDEKKINGKPIEQLKAAVAEIEIEINKRKNRSSKT